MAWDSWYEICTHVSLFILMGPGLIIAEPCRCPLERRSRRWLVETKRERQERERGVGGAHVEVGQATNTSMNARKQGCTHVGRQ